MAHGDITHIEIPVNDFAAATEFYHQLFSWEISEAEGMEGYPMWRAPNGISGGGLVQRDETITQPRVVVEVKSAAETLEQAVALGATVVMPVSPITDESSWALFKDTDGNVIGIYEDPTTAA